MKTGLWPTLGLIAVGFIPGLFLAGGSGLWKLRAERAAAEAVQDSLKREVRFATTARDVIAKELIASAVKATELQLRAEAARDSSNLWQRRFSSLPRPAPFDTAGWMANLPRFLAVTDSSMAACDDAVQTCHETLEAKNHELSVSERLRLAEHGIAIAQEQRAINAEKEWDQAANALERKARWQKFKIGGSFLAGVGTCVGTYTLIGRN